MRLNIYNGEFICAYVDEHSITTSSFFNGGIDLKRWLDKTTTFEEKRDIFLQAVTPKIDYDLAKTDTKWIQSKRRYDFDNSDTEALNRMQQADTDRDMLVAKFKAIENATSLEDLEAIEI